MPIPPSPQQTALSGSNFLDGQFLVAMPGMADERFARSVIYICAHSADGAMGIIVNKAAADISMPDLLVQLDVAPEADAIRLRERVGHMPVLMGGPVEGRRGFVLHTDDFHIQQSTLIIDDGICLTATVEILRAIASGEGPASAVLALGYAGWQAGQLESEIMANGWLNCPADPELIFNPDLDAKYERALRGNGIDPAMLSMTAGRA
ncbi:YqgE/AlgH family protein [Methylobacterium sp. NEAU 140]|uniref:YqgE/AlgH family protein n=1 Tax=Methylobacterium sp. NEAU 140 TaxID=3064945 RepID=UPI002736AB3A|nr:YqgE/AlgH family protein [Methylobacterium sp. NEAU 140]MDP4022730.1 YqgE/AlgH family protein [Methylobacterium sp. NEAU 140]